MPRFACLALACTSSLAAQGLTWITNPATGNEYARTPTPLSWAAAQQFAESVGAHLCVIDDAAENQWVANQFLFLFDLYLGGTDRFVQGNWTTPYGWPLGYTNWAVAPAISMQQPDASGDCLVMWEARPLWGIAAGAWDDQPGDFPLFAVLERPIAQSLAYGAGCSGSNGAPTLALAAGSSQPAPGALLELHLGQLPPAGGAAIAVLSLAPLQLDLAPLGLFGCDLLVDLEAGWLRPVFHATDTAIWQEALPDLPALRGLRAYAQALVLDVGANPFGATTTNGLELRLGF